MEQTIEKARELGLQKANSCTNGTTIDDANFDFLCAKFEDALLEGAEWQRKQSPWISVKDKLPDDNDVLVTDGNFTDLAIIRRTENGWFWDVYGEDVEVDEITHWMPIPKLPKKNNRMRREK